MINVVVNMFFVKAFLCTFLLYRPYTCLLNKFLLSTFLLYTFMLYTFDVYFIAVKIS